MFEPLLKYYLDYFQEKGEPALITLCNLKIPSDILLMQYDKMPSIESIPIEQKKELWEYAKTKYPDGTLEQRTRFCKIVHTVGNLIN